MDKSNPGSRGVLQTWVKPAAIIAIVFGIGFALPLLTKNVVTKQTGVAPSPVPTEAVVMTGPGYKFNPEVLEVSVGKSGTASVLLKTGKNKIEAFDFVLSYDEELVNVVSIKTSALFPTYPIVEYGNGTIKVSGTVGVADPVSVSETVFLIEFKGVSSGEAEMNIDMDESTIAAQGKNVLEGSNTLKIKVTGK